MVEIGSTIGNYEVLQKIGEGAMGVVFLARHPTIGKRVALKVIHPELAEDEDVVARFFNEARAVTQIGHQHIVDVQDFGQTPSGESFLVMELLEGSTLSGVLKQSGPLPIARAVHIAVQLADGLQAAHARGIVHRDLKPDNIFLIRRGQDDDFVKILDFGLAKLTGPGAIAHKTKTGVLVGTPHYMAPEAAEEPKKADHRIDVYALGCIVFEMLTGRVPFPGDGFGEVLVRHLREPPPLPSRLRPEMPPWLEKLILHALAKKQAFRLGSMQAFADALRNPAGFESAFDNAELSAQHACLAEPVVEPPQPVALRQAQISPYAKTLVVEAPTQIDREAPVFPQTPAPTQKPKLLGPIVGAILIVVSGFGIAGYLLFAKVHIDVATTPSGAEILVDGQRVGVSPLRLALDRRRKVPFELVLRRPGFVAARQTVQPVRDARIDVVLEAVAAPVEIPPVEIPPVAPSPVIAAPVVVAKKPVAHRAKPKIDTPEYKQEGLLLTPSF